MKQLKKSWLGWGRDMCDDATADTRALLELQEVVDKRRAWFDKRRAWSQVGCQVGCQVGSGTCRGTCCDAGSGHTDVGPPPQRSGLALVTSDERLELDE